jgi:nucleoid-associated protein YgaU
MGLFDFVKDMGQKLFDRDDDAAAKIQQHIEADNPGIDGLKVNYVDGVVKLGGTPKDQAALEKAVLMAGNVKGVTEVKLDEVPPPTGLKVEFYTIQSGDTLSGIAKKYYGSANQYPKIFDANQEVIKDANKIYPGQKIRIPLQ